MAILEVKPLAKVICILTQVRVNFSEVVLTVRMLNFQRESLCHGVLNFKCLMINHGMFNTQLEHVLVSPAVIHLHVTACPTSQTRNFPERCTNLVPYTSIWTQKILITFMAYAFSLLYRASDRMR